MLLDYVLFPQCFQWHPVQRADESERTNGHHMMSGLRTNIISGLNKSDHYLWLLKIFSTVIGKIFSRTSTKLPKRAVW